MWAVHLQVIFGSCRLQVAAIILTSSHAFWTFSVVPDCWWLHQHLKDAREYLSSLLWLEIVRYDLIRSDMDHLVSLASICLLLGQPSVSMRRNPGPFPIHLQTQKAYEDVHMSQLACHRSPLLCTPFPSRMPQRLLLPVALPV